MHLLFKLKKAKSHYKNYNLNIKFKNITDKNFLKILLMISKY